MNGYPTNDVDVFLRRLSLLNYYTGKADEFKEELKNLNKSMSNIPSSSSWGISVPYGEKEILDGKEVIIESKYITMPVTRNGYHKPNLDILWRIEELETMIIQYQTEIDYITDTLDICSDIVCDTAKRIFADGEKQESVAESIPLARQVLIRRIKREIGYALKGADVPIND